MKLASVAVGCAFALVVAVACNSSFRFDDQTFDAGTADAPPPASCTSDTDCPTTTLHCDTSSGACVPCVNDSNCTALGLHHCDTIEHDCIECATNNDCNADAGLVCESTSQRCLPKCREEHDCPLSAPACDESRGVCVYCQLDVQCAGDEPYCNRSSGTCVKCLADKQCPFDRPHCDTSAGACFVCVTNADCPSFEACDPVQHQCL